MPQVTPEPKSLRHVKAVHTSWAKTVNPTARTAPGRDAFLASFEKQVDPDNVLTPEDRARRARHALKAHMADLALKSARARRKAS